MPARRLPLLAVLALALAAALPAAVSAAAPVPRIAHARMVYYDVGGVTAEQIRARLNVRAPHSPDGFRGDAYTRWQFRWN